MEHYVSHNYFSQISTVRSNCNLRIVIPAKWKMELAIFYEHIVLLENQKTMIIKNLTTTVAPKEAIFMARTWPKPWPAPVTRAISFAIDFWGVFRNFLKKRLGVKNSEVNVNWVTLDTFRNQSNKNFHHKQLIAKNLQIGHITTCV